MGVGPSTKNTCDLFSKYNHSKISGIHDVTIVHCKGKRFYLIGERHSREGACSPDDKEAIPVNTLLQQIVEDQDKNKVEFDLFIEHIYKHKEKQRTISQDQVDQDNLGGMRAYLEKFTMEHPNSTVRSHYTDVRDFLGGLEYYNPGYPHQNGITAVLDTVVTQNAAWSVEETEDKKKREAERASKFRENMVNMLEEMYFDPLLNFIGFGKVLTGGGNPSNTSLTKMQLWKQRILQNERHSKKDISSRRAFNNALRGGHKQGNTLHGGGNYPTNPPRLRRGNILEKQLRNNLLTEDEVNALLTYFSSFIQRYFEQKSYYLNDDRHMMRAYLMEMNQWEEDWGEPAHPVEVIKGLAEAIQRLWVCVHDLYTVFRMFKPYVSTCSVFYGGSAHCQSIARMLELVGGTIEKTIRANSAAWSCLDLGIAKTEGI